MKTSKLVVAVVIFSMFQSLLAEGYLPRGKTQLNFGVGLSNWGIPVYFGFDHSLQKDLTIGAELSFRSYREDFRKVKYNHSIIGFSGNINYHFNSLLNIPQKWDFYMGANLGFYAWNSPSFYPGTHNSGLGLGGQIGGRYKASNKIGLNLEFGGGNAFSGGKFGVTIKV